MNLLQPAAMNMENHSQNNKEEECLEVWFRGFENFLVLSTF